MKTIRIGNCEVTSESDATEGWGKCREPIHALSQAKTTDCATAYLAVVGKLVQGNWDCVHGWDEYSFSQWDFYSGRSSLRCQIDAFYGDDCRIELTIQYEIDGEDQSEVKAIRKFTE